MTLRNGSPSLFAALLVAAVFVLASCGAEQEVDRAEAPASDSEAETPAPAADAVEGGPARVGEPAPRFTLTDTEGKVHRLADYLADGKTVVLEWFNPDCPFIQKHHAHHKTMNELEARFRDQDVVWLAVNSGAPGKQGHGRDHNRQAHERFGMTFPILLDEEGRVGRAYEAKTTPHMYVISSDGILLYQGAIDDNRHPTDLGVRNHVAAALEEHLAGEEVSVTTSEPYGCSVKYGEARIQAM
ncbi:MAG: redoxin domain-containing protein [Candidatus Eisenbacteria bacterium]|nr:redoxin domain-containing protein [Candidatus Latescibacterota bacterium]MBD3302790.1 redoxin domain-containing protein [Candidatus Eisenbacteria bacterium]